MLNINTIGKLRWTRVVFCSEHMSMLITIFENVLNFNNILNYFSFYVLLLKLFSFGLKGRETGKHYPHMLVYYPTAHKDQGQARQKPGA